MKYLVLLLVLIPALSWSFEPDFSPEERAKLEKGELVVREKRDPKEAWPEVTAFKILNADAEHAMAIFAGYDDQKNYVPNMIESTPVAQPSPTQVTVAYKLKMGWPVGEVRYTHEHQLQALTEQKGYRLDWKMIESTSTEFVAGHVIFLPHSNNQSLMIYFNKVRPKSFFASMVRGIMIKDLKESLQITSERIEKSFLAPENEKTQQYLMILRDSLKNKFHWVPQ